MKHKSLEELCVDSKKEEEIWDKTFLELHDVLMDFVTKLEKRHLNCYRCVRWKGCHIHDNVIYKLGECVGEIAIKWKKMNGYGELENWENELDALAMIWKRREEKHKQDAL